MSSIPIAYDDVDKPKPFCPVIVLVLVKPDFLVYENVITSATAVQEILVDARFHDIEVAPRGSEMRGVWDCMYASS